MNLAFGSSYGCVMPEHITEDLDLWLSPIEGSRNYLIYYEIAEAIYLTKGAVEARSYCDLVVGVVSGNQSVRPVSA